jgi:hypothetical protein
VGVKACQVGKQGLPTVFAADDCGVGIAPVEHCSLSVSHGICGESCWGSSDTGFRPQQRTDHEGTLTSDAAGKRD